MKLAIVIFLIGLLAAWSGQAHAAQGEREDAATETGGIESQEVSWALGPTRVWATLTRPASQGPCPAVVLVAGSGPTDRDWNSPLLPGRNGSGRLLAEALSGAGYLALRYDKRFCGPHAAENLDHLLGQISFQSHLNELAGAVAFLAGRSEVDSARLFVLANSEGCLHALNYQRQAGTRRFTGLILTGLPGRSFADLIRAQVGAQLAGLADSEVLISLFDQVVSDFLAGRPVSSDERLPNGLRQLIHSLTEPANLPFTRELMAADATKMLPEAPGAILIIIGQKDIQVDWRVDGGLLEAAAAGRDEVAFSKKLYVTIDEIQTDLDDFMTLYNAERTNQGKYCQGRTPLQAFIDGLELYQNHVFENEVEKKNAA